MTATARTAQLSLLLACGEILSTALVRAIYGVSIPTAKRDLVALRQALPVQVVVGPNRTTYLVLEGL